MHIFVPRKNSQKFFFFLKTEDEKLLICEASMEKVNVN